MREQHSNGQRLLYNYGTDGSLVGFAYNGTYYYYGKNIFGDIVDIYAANGTKVAHYVYDAWGNHEVRNPNGIANTSPSFIGNINPFRYRGYYYDTETGFYYLQSRYYDPATRHFLNADALSYLGAGGELHGYNLYAYCGNNPVMYYDPFGNSLLLIGLALLTTTVIGGLIGGITSYKNGFRGLDVVKYTALGAGLGLAVGGAFIATIAVGVGAVAAMSGATSIASVTVFGAPVLQAFAVGALAFNTFAYVFAPFFGVVDMQGIEYKPIISPSSSKVHSKTFTICEFMEV